MVLVRAARHTVTVTLQARAHAGGGSAGDKARDWWPAPGVKTAEGRTAGMRAGMGVSVRYGCVCLCVCVCVCVCLCV